MPRADQRGGALWEAIPVFGIVSGLVLAVLLAAYLLFARAHVIYQGEQALYCVAERQPPGRCRERFARRVKSFLPWGELRVRSLESSGSGASMRGDWRWMGFRVALDRRLDLPSSKASRSFRW